jgi:hypothetical protein
MGCANYHLEPIQKVISFQFGYFYLSRQNRQLALLVLGLSYNEILHMLTIRKGGLPNYEQLPEQFQKLNKHLEFINMNGTHQELA